MKTCSKCKEYKPFDMFFKHKQTADKRHSWCKQCCKEGNKRSNEKLNSTIEGRAKVFLRNAQKSADKRGQEFQISLDDIVECWNRQDGYCAYTGRKMCLESGKLETVSIERIDSAKGYIPENTVLVCQSINRMKSDFIYEEFFNLCKDVTTFLSDEELRLSVGAFK